MKTFYAIFSIAGVLASALFVFITMFHTDDLITFIQSLENKVDIIWYQALFICILCAMLGFFGYDYESERQKRWASWKKNAELFDDQPLKRKIIKLPLILATLFLVSGCVTTTKVQLNNGGTTLVRDWALKFYKPGQTVMLYNPNYYWQYYPDGIIVNDTTFCEFYTENCIFYRKAVIIEQFKRK